MGSSSSTYAPNDLDFLASAMSLQDSARQTTVPYTPLVHCFKPFCRTSLVPEIMQYPSHPKFRERVSYEMWKTFNADLDEALYRASLHCVCVQLGCPLTALFGCVIDRQYNTDFNALYEMISHYNRVLFRPLLIEAQIFYRDPKIGVGVSSPWLISFLIARSEDELRSFPQPIPGISSGYRTHSMMPLPCFEMNYHLEEPSENNIASTSTSGASVSLEPVFPHSMERLAQDPQPLWDLWPCCPVIDSSQIKLRLQAQPIAMQRQRASSWLFPLAFAEINQPEQEPRACIVNSATSSASNSASEDVEAVAAVAVSASESTIIESQGHCTSHPTIVVASARRVLHHSSRAVPVSVMINTHCSAVAQTQR